MLLDSIALKDLPALVAKAASLFPTTSNASEGRQNDVAKQAEDAALKASALLKATADRLTEIGVALATHVLPPLNAFLDKLITFGKSTGLISETTGEKNARVTKEGVDALAAARRAERETYAATPQGMRNKTQADALRKQMEEDRQRPRAKDASPDPEGWLQYFRRMLSPETNASKLQKTAEQSTDQRKYENIGNDQRVISPTVNVQASGLDAVASAVKNAVLGAISTKGANTSTGALTAP